MGGKCCVQAKVESPVVWGNLASEVAKALNEARTMVESLQTAGLSKPDTSNDIEFDMFIYALERNRQKLYQQQQNKKDEKANTTTNSPREP
jgi:hypothetical protein